MQESQRLIVSAYERARGSGKLDWNKMTTAVLKNRLLDLTRGAFDETTFLDAPDDRQQFNKDHGRQQSRYDKNGFHWERAHDMHGREVLYVAGRPLIKGFHWDVGLRTRGAKTVSNTVAIWKVPAHGHVNIYPDAHIRKGHKSTKIYSG